MKKYTQEELNTIIELHQKWLNNEEDGVRANLYEADLSYTDLSYTDLSYTDLSYANLYNTSILFTSITGTKFHDKLTVISHPLYNIQIKGKNFIKVGCQDHSLDQWLSLSFSEEEIKKMVPDALEFYPILIKYLKTTFDLE